METVNSISTNKKSISALWAVDPLDREHLPNHESLAQARVHLGGSFENTLPVFVCDPHYVDLVSPEEKVQKYLQELETGPILRPEVISSQSDKKSDLVEELLREAKSRKAELILVTNHGRRGIAKLLVGSFAEHLLKKSHLPILFLGEGPSEKSRWNRALFATDFSKESYEAFLEFVRMTSLTCTELLVFHAVPIPTELLTSTHMGGMPIYFSSSFWDEQTALAKKEIKTWIQAGSSAGMKVHFHAIVKEALGAPGPAIVDIAKREGVSLIGMSSHEGTSHFGSVTKEVLAAHEFEVWATGPCFRRADSI